MDKSTGKKEIFFANKNHASWGIIWKNTHLEFAHSINVYSDKNEDNAH